MSATSSAAVAAASTATAASAAATLSSVDDYLSVVESVDANALNHPSVARLKHWVLR